METQVTYDVPREEMESALDTIKQALNPKVSFSEDMDMMRKEHDEVRHSCLIQLLGWVRKYSP